MAIRMFKRILCISVSLTILLCSLNMNVHSKESNLSGDIGVSNGNSGSQDNGISQQDSIASSGVIDSGESETDDSEPDKNKPNESSADEGLDVALVSTSGVTEFTIVGSEFIPIADSLVILDAQTAVVTTHAQLKNALENNNGIQTVYLGADIQLLSGISINPTKTNLTIDGLYPLNDTGAVHTLTDMASTEYADTIGIRSASSLSITIQNMSISGHNHNGIFYGQNDADVSHVSVTFINVDYTGPQMVFHPYGMLRLIDCRISIVAANPASAEQLAETNRVELGGDVTINHVSTSDAVFRFRGTSPSLTVLPDAHIRIAASNYLIYTTNPVAFAVQEGAELEINTVSGIFYSSSHQFSSVLIDTNASLRVIQTTRGSGYATIYCSGNFTVAQGATLYMQANYANAAPLIQFTSLHASLNIINPKSVVLYNSSSNVLGFALTTAYSIQGGQLNCWHSASALDHAGRLSDVPQHSWRKQDGTPLHIVGSAVAGLISISQNNFTQFELLNLPDLSLFGFSTVEVLSIGDLPLKVDTITNNKNPIIGVTQPWADISATYTLGGTPKSLTGQADIGGAFSIPVSDETPIDTTIQIKVGINFLTSWATRKSVDAGGLRFDSVPNLLDFGTIPIPARKTTFKRLDANWKLTVYDSRVYSHNWNLYAQIDSPMSTNSNHSLTDSLIFIDQQNTKHMLGNSPTLVFAGGPNGGTTKVTTIAWTQNNGILLHINPIKVNANEPYRAIITWTLVNAP